MLAYTWILFTRILPGNFLTLYNAEFQAENYSEWHQLRCERIVLQSSFVPAGGRLYKSPAKQAYLKSKALYVSLRVRNLFFSFLILIKVLYAW